MNPLAASLLVAAGGALGAVARYWVGVAGAMMFGVAFPYYTLFVNVVGSFLIGYVAFATWTTPGIHAITIAGFLGGFTTFSAFSLEVVRMVEDEKLLRAGFYIALSVTVSVMAAVAGVSLARHAP